MNGPVTYGYPATLPQIVQVDPRVCNVLGRDVGAGVFCVGVLRQRLVAELAMMRARIDLG